MTEAVCTSRSLGRGRVLHLGAFLALGLLALLLLAAGAERVGRSWYGRLVDNEAGVALLGVPLKAH
ncbi:hypothetical protein A7L51_19000 [Acinetobacter baumannii]|nr:hypothetical protein A7L51_19000 [Acinetobacter baumannii]